MDLIKITHTDNGIVVSARHLCEFLDIKTKFKTWIPRMFAYGFKKDIDYTLDVFVHPANNQRVEDFALTLDCAKHIAMIQRSDKGMAARNWFIKKEKELRAIQTAEAKPKSPAHAFLEIAKAMVDHEDRLLKIESRLTTRPETYSIAGYARLKNIKVNLKKAAQLGREASRICKLEGIETDSTHDPRFGSVKVYPLEVLEEVFNAK